MTVTGSVRAPSRLVPPRREQGSPLLYDLICPRQDWLWDYEADGSRGLEVDHQLELRRLLERQIGGLGALEARLKTTRPRASTRTVGRFALGPGLGGRPGEASVIVTRHLSESTEALRTLTRNIYDPAMVPLREE